MIQYTTQEALGEITDRIENVTRRLRLTAVRTQAETAALKGERSGLMQGLEILDAALRCEQTGGPVALKSAYDIINERNETTA